MVTLPRETADLLLEVAALVGDERPGAANTGRNEHSGRP